MITSFDKRSNKAELLDGDQVSFAAIKRNMQELEVINRQLGGHKVTLKGITQLLANDTPRTEKIIIAEMGCGGGDNLRVIRDWAQKKKLEVQLIGIDINRDCIAYARQQTVNKNIQFICADYKEVVFSQKPQVLFSSLFCHHFTNEQLVDMLQWMQRHTSVGFFINDLHRHALAYYSIQLLTKLFSKSYLVKNDAPLSVQRSFTKEEWTALFNNAGVLPFDCNWQWAFRWLVTYQHANK
jgi:2-polyprenyl-3-methyl-5-hydroxy-6-metoxy-1,4-benzoquinol methylase